LHELHDLTAVEAEGSLCQDGDINTEAMEESVIYKYNIYTLLELKILLTQLSALLVSLSAHKP